MRSLMVLQCPGRWSELGQCDPDDADGDRDYEESEVGVDERGEDESGDDQEEQEEVTPDSKSLNSRCSKHVVEHLMVKSDRYNRHREKEREP